MCVCVWGVIRAINAIILALGSGRVVSPGTLERLLDPEGEKLKLRWQVGILRSDFSVQVSGAQR